MGSKLLALVGLLLATSALGAPPPGSLQAVEVASGFNQPLLLAAPAGDPRLFVVERAGRIWIVSNGQTLSPAFLDIRSRVGCCAGERGLLGLAFPPDFATSGEFYVHYTDLAGASTLSRFLVSAGSPNLADANSEVVLVTPIAQPATNHNGGSIAFGPFDGMLYWALGDGGGGNDTYDNGQNPLTPLGAILRLDVGGGPQSLAQIPPDNPFVGDPTALDEIWAYGLRNPFRMSFDRQTGELWIGDVGQAAREEVDREPAHDPADPQSFGGGRNYGWPIHEGSLCHLPQPGLPCEDPAAPDLFTFPVYEYPQTNDPCDSITGGYVYRGVLPELQGHYLFGDFCRNQLWLLDPATLVETEVTADLTPPGGLGNVAAIGEDGFGELYVVSLGLGTILRVASTAPDADGDFVPDLLDNCPATPNRSQGDADEDGVGDACDAECHDGLDNDGDGLVDDADPQCLGGFGARERGSRRCGLGFELALAVPLLLGLRRASRSR